MENTTAKNHSNNYKVQPNDPASLGQIIQDFPVKNQTLNFWVRLITGIGLLIASGLIALWGIWWSWTTIAAHGRAVLLRTASTPLMTSGFFLLTGAVLIYFAWRHRKDGITLYNDGFHLRRGKQSLRWTWDSIDSFNTLIEHTKFATSIVNVRVRIVMAQCNGNSIILRNRYEDMPTLLNIIREQVIPRLHQSIIHRMGQGEAISFHPRLAAMKEGLQINQAHYAWESLSEPLLKNRSFILKNKLGGESIFKTNIRRISNLDVLLILLTAPPNQSLNFSPK